MEVDLEYGISLEQDLSGKGKKKIKVVTKYVFYRVCEQKI